MDSNETIPIGMLIGAFIGLILTQTLEWAMVGLMIGWALGASIPWYYNLLETNNTKDEGEVE